MKNNLAGFAVRFGVNEKRLNRMLVWVSERFAKSPEMVSELSKARESVEFQEAYSAFKQDLVDHGLSRNAEIERMPHYLMLLDRHALLSGVKYYLYSVRCLDGIFKDKQTMADKDSKSRLYSMVAGDKDFARQADSVLEDEYVKNLIFCWDTDLMGCGYIEGLKDNALLRKMLSVHAYKAGEAYFDVVMSHNLVEMAKRMVR